MEKKSDDPKVIFYNDKPVGFDFGMEGYSDLGFGDLFSSFSISLFDDVYGYDRLKIEDLPTYLHIGEYENYSYIISLPMFDLTKRSEGEVMPNSLEEELSDKIKEYLDNVFIPPEDLNVFYDWRGFVLFGRTDIYGELIRDFEAAFYENDVVIGTSLCPEISNFGLMIYSKIPDMIKNFYRQIDMELRKEE